MNLFEVIPEKYFSICNSKNRFIFAEASLTLIEILETDENIINKNDFLKALKDKDKKSLEEFDLMAEEDVTLDDSIIIDNLSAKASFIVRRLEETGWINIAMDPEKFEETIILPPFSIIIHIWKKLQRNMHISFHCKHKPSIKSCLSTSFKIFSLIFRIKMN